jgi:hypothetical protein
MVTVTRKVMVKSCEISTQAKNAFKMAFKDNIFLPEEIIIDNDSIYRRKIFKRFLFKLNNLEVITTKAHPNIPTWKAEIESSFAVFRNFILTNLGS